MRIGCSDTIGLPYTKTLPVNVTKALKKYYGKNQEQLDKNLTEIVVRWVKEGLKKDVLIKLKDKIISVLERCG